MKPTAKSDREFAELLAWLKANNLQASTTKRGVLVVERLRKKRNRAGVWK
jgi:hypothetical protein